MIMKRYMVFSYEEFYPNGGLLDVSFSSDDKYAAVNFAEKENIEFCYVWDRVTGETVWGAIPTSDLLDYLRSQKGDK